jgi:hypothetical protein
VGDDASGGAWDHIATKLNANADLHRGYNVKKNAKPDAARNPTQVPTQ